MLAAISASIPATVLIEALHPTAIFTLMHPQWRHYYVHIIFLHLAAGSTGLQAWIPAYWKTCRFTLVFVARSHSTGDALLSPIVRQQGYKPFVIHASLWSIDCGPSLSARVGDLPVTQMHQRHCICAWELLHASILLHYSPTFYSILITAQPFRQFALYISLWIL